MARKSGPRQLKRGPAPGFWPIHRKEAKWAPATRPGPHLRNRSFPLILIVREILGYGATAKEATRIISGSKIRVDRVVRNDPRFSVGLMDLIQISGINQVFRLLPRPGRGLALSPVREGESEYKVCKVLGKRVIDKEMLQINLHDGRTLVVSSKGVQKGYSEFSVGGGLQIALPSQKIIGYVPLEQGSIGLVTYGKNQGSSGKIAAVTGSSYARSKIATIEMAGDSFETPADYVLPIGLQTSLVSLEG